MPVYSVTSPNATDPASMVALAASGCAGAAVVAIRTGDLVCPVRQGAAGQIRSGLVVNGSEKIRTGDEVVWLTVTAITPANVMRDGQVRAQGKACDHVRLGVFEEQLNATTGCPDAIGQVAATIPHDITTPTGKKSAPGRKKTSAGKKKESPVGKKRARSTRVMNDALAIRAIILMTVMPDADYRQIMTCLFGGLVHVPWKNAPLVIPSPSVLTNWRKKIPAWVLVRLQDMMFTGTDGELSAEEPTVIDVGGGLRLCSLDGSVTKMADTTANRDTYGSTSTTSDNAAYPHLRQLHASDASTRATLGSNHGPAGTDKAESEQALLDRMLIEYAFIFTRHRLWVMDRNFPGVPRITRILKTGTHVLIRLKSDIKLTRVGATLPDGSYLAILSGGGETIIMRVIEYLVTVAGRQAPDMFCLVTDLTDHIVHPADKLAAAYRWRWDGSETALREAKSTIRGAGPSTGAILRSTTPELIAQELAAWMLSVELIHALARAAAHTTPAYSKGRLAGQSVHARQISFTTARHTAIATVASGPATAGLPTATAAYHTAVTTIGKARVTTDRHRHRPRQTKTNQPFTHAPRTITTSTATAHLHICGAPKAA